jgi:hypothetical protein
MMIVRIHDRPENPMVGDSQQTIQTCPASFTFSKDQVELVVDCDEHFGGRNHLPISSNDPILFRGKHL